MYFIFKLYSQIILVYLVLIIEISMEIQTLKIRIFSVCVTDTCHAFALISRTSAFKLQILISFSFEFRQITCKLQHFYNFT